MLVEALALDKDKETVSTKSALSVYHMGALGALGGFGGLWGASQTARLC